ncbi:MAG: efflux RND transporter permease subunit [Epsilonproteobacteria bacterium]|nr:efflux RND transporter permease subunit [Campylobacterota bacterium]
MNLIQFSIKNSVTVIVAVLIALLFGFLALDKLPYQLTPSVTKPEIKVTTIWPGATPYEIEQDIIEEQEKVLKSLNNLISYESSSQDNLGEITLTFNLGVDSNQILLDVSNKLNEVPSYPENVEQPIIKSSQASPVIWMMLQTADGNQNHIDTYKTFYENDIRENFDRIDGVADIMQIGGTEKEMQIILDTAKLAQFGLTIPEVMNIIKNENVDISAGIQNVERKSYRIRTTGKLRDPKTIENITLFSDREQRILLKDVATISFGYEDKAGVAMFLGKDGLFMGIQPTASANIVELTNKVENAVHKLNEGLLAQNGLKILWLFDQRPYIVGSVDLVKQNIMIGGVLAIIMLILFLRSIAPTAVAAVAIPISIIASFIILDMLGRSLNTISLAGLAFAVGMLVDSAIVVLENIDRHRKLGKSLSDAAYQGTSEVWGALIASASTTVAVFLPIIFLQDEAGQLFKDIAIAVVSAVSFSLFVSISVIPMLWKKIALFSERHQDNKPSAIANFGTKLSNMIMAVVNLTLKNLTTRIITIVLLTALSVMTIKVLFPKTDYLPQGNRNLIFNILIPPPGFSYNERHEIGTYLFEQIAPYVNQEKDGFPPINRGFYVSLGDFHLFGGTSGHEDRAKELIPLYAPIVNSLPGIFGVSIQSGVFEQGVGEGNTVDIDISGESIEKIANVGGMLFGATMQAIQGSQVRPIPSIELLYPEVRLIPDRDALSALGMSTRSFGESIDVLMNGRQVGDFQQDGKKKIDLVVKAASSKIKTPEDIYYEQIALPDGSLVPVSSLAKLERTTGISQIRHYNGKRTITLQVTPPKGMTIQEAMEIIKGGILPQVEQSGATKDLEITLSGTADKLSLTIEMLSFNIIMALVIIYLLMSALFGNFIYPLVIMATVPLATAGGFLGLHLVNKLGPQPLDILTMLGFIILIGIVVNNAILIVHQSLNLLRGGGYTHKEAVVEATRSRIRPIYMSSLTSIFGMLPLVLAPGPGSEFYRGLGSVITGGLTLSTFFTIFITPALLMFFIKMEKINKKEPSHES